MGKRRKAWIEKKYGDSPREKTPAHLFRYVQLARLDVEDFVAICEKLAEHGEKVSARKKQWIKLIDAGKLTCAATNNPVAYLSYDITNHIDPSKRTYHFNFYDENDELMTVDHVYPKSLGGAPLDIENLQPMQGIHNWKKGSKLDYEPNGTSIQ